MLKNILNLVLAGGLDSFNNKRAQYFHMDADGLTFLEKAIKHGAKHQELLNSSQISMFEDGAIDSQLDLTMPDCDEWINLLRKCYH